MSLTIAGVGDNKYDIYGATPTGVFTVTMDTSYPAGGYALTAAAFGLSRPIAGVLVIGVNTAALVSAYQYNAATGKLQVLSTTAGAAGTVPFQDEDAATNLSTFVLTVLVICKR